MWDDAAMRGLRIPSALAVTVLAGGAALAGLTGTSGACGGGESPPIDAAMDSNGCAIFCLPEDETTECPVCADLEGMCPAGCTPIG
jgi:hypothetical protein